MGIEEGALVLIGIYLLLSLLTIGLIIHVIIGGVLSAIFVPLAVKGANYEEFVENNSYAVNNLKAINKSMIFYAVQNFDMRHAYDNRYNYKRISCKDYLISQLATRKSDVLLAIQCAENNKINFRMYQQRIKENCGFGRYIKPIPPKLRPEKVLEYEKDRFLFLLRRPVYDFHIKVKLVRSSSHDVYRESKTEIFDAEQIIDCIVRLNKKTRHFYEDEKIWESMCRVEEGKISNRLKKDIFDKNHYRCVRCGSRRHLEIDHIIPVSKGGVTSYSNLQTLCHRCHQRRLERLAQQGNNLNS